MQTSKVCLYILDTPKALSLSSLNSVIVRNLAIPRHLAIDMYTQPMQRAPLTPEQAAV